MLGLPHKTEKDIVKVFVPGLIQTDYAFIHRVVGTIRPWNEFSSSMERLLEMEFNSHLSEDNSDLNSDLLVRVRSIINRPSLHWAHIWWTDNFDLIHDALLKKYPINIVSYGRLLREPDVLIPSILNWCHSPLPSDINLYKRKLSIDMEKAIATVDTSLQTQASPQIDDHDLPVEIINVFDNFYDCFNHNNSEISPSIVKDLNMVQENIVDYRSKQIKKYIVKKNKDLIELGIKPEQARIILKNTKLFLKNDDKLRKILKI